MSTPRPPTHPTSMFYTTVEGFVFRGEYFDPRVGRIVRSLVVPVPESSVADDTRRIPGTRRSRKRLFVDELAMAIEKKERARAFGGHNFRSYVDLTGDENHAVEPEISVGLAIKKKGSTERVSSLTCVAHPISNIDRSPAVNNERVETGQKSRDESEIVSPTLDEVVNDENERKIDCDKATYVAMKKMFDSEAEEVNLIDEDEIRRDDAKYLSGDNAEDVGDN